VQNDRGRGETGNKQEHGRGIKDLGEDRKSPQIFQVNGQWKEEINEKKEFHEKVSKSTTLRDEPEGIKSMMFNTFNYYNQRAMKRRQRKRGDEKKKRDKGTSP